MDTLYQLEELVETSPDSAISALKNLANQTGYTKAPDAFKAYHSLLTVKAMDKGKLLQESSQTDSLISLAIDYYEEHPEEGFLAETYYYAGRVMSENHNGERALMMYNKALLKDTTHITAYLKSRIYASYSSSL